MVEAVIALGVLVLALVLLLPMLRAATAPHRSAQCSDNLRLLFHAASAYANDHNGVFFYDWNSKVHPDGTTSDPAGFGIWSDQKRLGNYIDSDRVRVVGQGGELGDGALVCPNEAENVSRSYGFNFWASGKQAQAEMTANQIRGRFFDASVANADKVLLFGEGYAMTATELERRWVLRSRFGYSGSPSSRFAGVGGEQRRRVMGEGRYEFFINWEVNYSLHGEVGDPLVPRGDTHFAYVDGHVSRKGHLDLYDPVTLQSTHNTLWGPDDRAFDDPPLEYTPLH